MAKTLISLPSETILGIANYLTSAADYVHFAICNKWIRGVLNNQHTVALALKRIARHSAEWELVRSKSVSARTGLRTLYRRQQAFSRARPSSVVVLGEGRSFLYREGVLAYVRGKTIRILDVHNACRTEGVLLSTLIGPQILGEHCNSTEFELYNLQDGLLTFMFHGETDTVGWRSWVVVINADYKRDAEDLESDRLRLAIDLWTPEELVARNDAKHVCFMSPTGTSINARHREWVCSVWDINDPESEQMTLQIPELAVGELGKSLVFEIFDGYLYAISTQSPFEMDEPQWTSYYTCFRFPLGNPHPLTLEKLRIWRRHHNEGPINDLWTDLKLHKDEATGELIIIEARKEWTSGSSTQKRTWYRQALPTVFPPPVGAGEGDEDMADANDQSGNQPQAPAANQSHVPASSSTSAEDPPYLHATLPDDEEPKEEPALRAPSLDQWPGHPRIPHDTHPEYPSNAPAPPIVDTFILAKSKSRSYNPSASAFLDLVVDDHKHPACQSDWAQNIRLRIGSRREESPLDVNGMIQKHWINNYTRQPVPDSELRYVDQGIHLWPPRDAPAVLQELLNGSSQYPSGHRSWDELGRRIPGDITAISDERSIVYLVKEKGVRDDKHGQLVLINFDKRIRFFTEMWRPKVLNLYRGQNVDPQPAEVIIMEAELKERNEPMEVDREKVYSEADVDDVEAYSEEETEDGGVDSEEDNENQEVHPGEDKRDQDAEGEEVQSDQEGKIIPADDVNDYFSNELYDDDDDESEPEFEWIIEEMAMWTDLQQGFRLL
ncbi:MAG: hypothetical protein L6R39_004997 [Caloplaca ligustica]|nr:MAG: hypothetical protein L6R39_004997 [Caloplaca ligustica]